MLQTVSPEQLKIAAWWETLIFLSRIISGIFKQGEGGSDWSFPGNIHSPPWLVAFGFAAASIARRVWAGLGVYKMEGTRMPAGAPQAHNFPLKCWWDFEVHHIQACDLTSPGTHSSRKNKCPSFSLYVPIGAWGWKRQTAFLCVLLLLFHPSRWCLEAIALAFSFEENPQKRWDYAESCACFHQTLQCHQPAFSTGCFCNSPAAAAAACTATKS